MNSLLDLIIYIYCNYPKVDELSKPRLVKIVYLIDWKYTIDHGQQVTDIEWYFHHYGPYVDDIIQLIKSEKEIFSVESRLNMFNDVSDRITYIGKKNVTLKASVQEVADYIMYITSNLNWKEFIDLVYSTYPIKNNSKYSFLNLKEEARQFKIYKEKSKLAYS
jgi:hypothetical protein